jgi:thymidylate synthase (FAD)
MSVSKNKWATLVDKMGDDLTVVNAARVSFNKNVDYSEDEYKFQPIAMNVQARTKVPKVPQLRKEDERLVKYLAEHGHWSPFSHCFLQFHIKAPIFVARQLVKHQVGLAWNEISRRYVDDEPEFYEPEEWRLAAENKKQGSSDETVEYSIEPAYIHATQCYNNMLGLGIAPEMARMVLPQSLMTEWYWSGSLYAFARVCNLRCKSDAQKETRLVCEDISNQIKKLFPVSWKYLTDLPAEEKEVATAS